MLRRNTASPSLFPSQRFAVHTFRSPQNMASAALQVSASFSIIAFESVAADATRKLQREGLLQVDLRRFGFFDIAALGWLFAFCSAARSGKLGTRTEPVEIILPWDDDRAMAYVFRCGLFGLAAPGDVFSDGIYLARRERDHNSTKSSYSRLPWMPLSRIAERRSDFDPRLSFENECQTFLNRIHTTFFTALIEQLGYSDEMACGFWVPNKEMFENIYIHSNSWGFAAIQCTKSGIVISFGDIGVGIRSTLDDFRDEICAEMNRSWSDETAVLAAFVEGRTRLPGASQGRGLPYVREYVEENDGVLELRSGNVKATFRANSKPVCTPVVWMPGVQTRIFLPPQTHPS